MVWKNDQVGAAETEVILRFARECLGVNGDFVEFGCYKGDTSLLLAEILREKDKKLADLNAKSKNDGFRQKLWIYDSFEGLPEKREVDFSELGRDFKAGELAVSKREVKERFLRAGLPVPVITKAWFKDLTETDLPERIAFGFLDGDLYESIEESLKLVEGRMVNGGVILVHDYDNLALPGVAKAVDEWAKKHKIEAVRVEGMALIRF